MERYHQLTSHCRIDGTIFRPHNDFSILDILLTPHLDILLELKRPSLAGNERGVDTLLGAFAKGDAVVRRRKRGEGSHVCWRRREGRGVEVGEIGFG
jgi:hypothetical protein